MSALLSRSLEKTSPSDPQSAGSSPREVGIRILALLGTTVLLLLAGAVLLPMASGLQSSHAAAGVQPQGVSAPQDPAQEWQPSAANPPPKLPREWVWKPPGVRYEHMFRKAR
jgi:hypothetical protein